jgi:hypothetical protein
VSSASVALDFFDVLDAPILSGRAFHSGDLQPGARTVIVNQSFAQVVLGGNNPIGRRLRDVTQQNGKDPWYQVVGVVRDFGIDPEDRDPRRDSRRARIYHPLVPGESSPACGPSPETSSPRFRSRRSPASIKSRPQVPVR